jgi:AraC-like DNA-binding protein/mannose-6-phosphate isomerase-like protein (cupin superfamily)
MKTKYISKRTKADISDDVEYVERIPRSIVAVALDYPNGYHIPPHRHKSAQLLYACTGVMTVTTKKGIWVIPPQRAVWVPALVEHQIFVSGRLSMRSLYIKPEAESDLPVECCVVTVPPLLRELILHAVTLPRIYPLNGPEARIMNVILDQIRSLSVSPLDLPIPKDPRLKKIHRAFIVNPADNRTLEAWGNMVGATSRTLTRLFQAETGMNFRQWRQQVRILEALRRLGIDEQVTSVALDMGYDSPSAFINMFKKALGKTPGQYFNR